MHDLASRPRECLAKQRKDFVGTSPANEPRPVQAVDFFDREFQRRVIRRRIPVERSRCGLVRFDRRVAGAGRIFVRAELVDFRAAGNFAFAGDVGVDFRHSRAHFQHGLLRVS